MANTMRLAGIMIALLGFGTLLAQSARAAGSCEVDYNNRPDFLRASACLIAGGTVFSEQAVGGVKKSPDQSRGECARVLAHFQGFGITPKDIYWFAPWDDPRFSEKHSQGLIFTPYKCTDGIPRMLVRLREGRGALGLEEPWMQFPERIPVESRWLGGPKAPVPNR